MMKKNCWAYHLVLRNLIDWKFCSNQSEGVKFELKIILKT